MPFISLFYPAADAAEHFVEGQHLEIAGPMFRTYAEAVSELEQETSDVVEQGLPVEPYVLEVKPLRGGGGYSIVEVYEVSFPTMRGGARARNPREPKMVEMPELRGIRTGADRQLTLDEAAAVYGDFMAHNLPLGVPASKVRRAFGAAVTPPAVERQRHEAAAVRQKAVGKVSSSVTKAVEAHGVDGAKALTEEKLAAVAEALDAGQITAAQAAPVIALETKRLEILNILQRFCPPVGEEGAAAIYEVTRAILGGDEAAAEAGRLVLEEVASRFSSRPVEVDDSAVPAPKKGRGKAAAKASGAGAAAAVFTGNVTDFVKAYGSRIRGGDKLAKAIVANAVGLAPFPTGFPVAELRDATSDVYALLAEAGVIAQPAVFAAPAPVYIPEPEPLPVAQFDDPGLQAVFGGLPVPPLPEQPDDYIIREYSYETGLPVYGMRFGGKLPPDRTPDLAQAIAVAERAGVQTHTYYDTALQSGGADFRPIEEAFARDAEERRFATQIVEMPVPEPPPAPVAVSAAPDEIEYREGMVILPKLTQDDIDRLNEGAKESHRIKIKSALDKLMSLARLGAGKTNESAWNKAATKLILAQNALGIVGADRVEPDIFANRWPWLLAYLKRLETVSAPAPSPVAAPALSAEEQLAAKIAAGNEAGLARLQAMLNG